MLGMYRRQLYPPNWPELAQTCKERAQWECEHCGAKQYELKTSRRGTPYLIYLHAAHKNHDPQNPNPELLCLCISCHACLDYQYKQREARVRLEILKHLRLLINAGHISVREEIYQI